MLRYGTDRYSIGSGGGPGEGHPLPRPPRRWVYKYSHRFPNVRSHELEPLPSLSHTTYFVTIVVRHGYVPKTHETTDSIGINPSLGDAVRQFAAFDNGWFFEDIGFQN